MIYQCKCNKQVECTILDKNTNNPVDSLMQDLGWSRIYCPNLGFFWICESCTQIVREATQKIFETVKTPHLTGLPLMDREAVAKWNQEYHQSRRQHGMSIV